MSFLERIKADLLHDHKQRGLRANCVVDARALLELVDHYERMDSVARLEYEAGHSSSAYHLHNSILAMYHSKNRDSEEVLCVIMDTLRPLIDEKRKLVEFRGRLRPE